MIWHMREIVIEGLTKKFGDRVVLDNVSFGVNKGDIHGFLGPNGAGKTTTMRIIANLLRPEKGSVTIEGVDNSKTRSVIHNHIGFLLEEPPLYRDMSVVEYLNFIGKLKRVSNEQLKKNLDYCIETLDLSPVINRSIENLSKGYKQRVGIAQALIHRPKILILDEPTVGLDPQSVIEVRNLILNLKQDHTVILSSHLLHEMSLVCDQVTIISEGRILETGTIESLRHKLAGKSNIELEVLKQTTEFDDYLKRMPGLIRMVTHTDKEMIRYEIVYGGEEDIRTSLLENSLKYGASPVGLTQKVYNLEEIFMKITEDKA